LIRAPLWLIGLLIVAAIVVGLYAYYTTPLPYGLGELIETPGGGNARAVSALPTAVPAATSTARAPAGQPLVLGAASVMVNSIARNQDLTAGGQGGPPGSFTVVDLQLANEGAEPLTPQAADFRLLDDRGRVYAVDAEATRTTNTFRHRRDVFAASVPPGARIQTYLAFEMTAEANPQTLRVAMGYGEAVLPAPAAAQ
jgi:Domain of unknown function (DUF4352)